MINLLAACIVYLFAIVYLVFSMDNQVSLYLEFIDSTGLNLIIVGRYYFQLMIFIKIEYRKGNDESLGSLQTNTQVTGCEATITERIGPRRKKLTPGDTKTDCLSVTSSSDFTADINN